MKNPDMARFKLKLRYVLLAPLLVSLLANGGELFRWTGKEGRVHYSDAVPAPQKGDAKKVDVTNARITDADRREAQARLDREKKMAAQRPTPVVEAPPPTTKPTPVATEFPKGKAACEEEWRKYHESVACFNPYRNTNGAIRGEAFSVCTSVPQPQMCP